MRTQNRTHHAESQESSLVIPIGRVPANRPRCIHSASWYHHTVGHRYRKLLVIRRRLDFWNVEAPSPIRVHHRIMCLNWIRGVCVVCLSAKQLQHNWFVSCAVRYLYCGSVQSCSAGHEQCTSWQNAQLIGSVQQTQQNAFMINMSNNAAPCVSASYARFVVLDDVVNRQDFMRVIDNLAIEILFVLDSIFGPKARLLVCTNGRNPLTTIGA